MLSLRNVTKKVPTLLLPQQGVKFNPIIFSLLLCFSIVYFSVIRYVFTPVIFSGSSRALIPGDPSLYDALAIELSGALINNGLFSVFNIFDGVGIVEIISLFYSLSSNSTIIVVVLNATLHALSCYYMYKIVNLVCGNATISLLSIIAFILSPYYVFWYAQINKETFFICGTVIQLYWVVRFLFTSERRHLMILYGVSSIIFGAFLLYFSRPLFSILLFLSISIAYFFYVLIKWHHLTKVRLIASAFALLLILSSAVIVVRTSSADSSRNVLAYADMSIIQDQPQNAPEVICQDMPHAADIKIYIQHGLQDKQVRATLIGERTDCVIGSFHSDILPSRAQAIVVGVIAQRQHYLQILGLENIDSRVLLQDMNEVFFELRDVISYLPRAIFLGLFSPLPNFWMTEIFHGKVTLFRLHLVLENLIVFLLAPYFIWNAFKRRLLSGEALIVAICLIAVSLIAFATPHGGTLDRYRYVFYMLLSSTFLASSIRCYRARNSLN